MKSHGKQNPPRRTQSETPARRVFVRCEDASGAGLFQVSGQFVDWFEFGVIRVPRKTKRAAADLRYQLGQHTPAPVRGAYDDERSREPITWYIGTDNAALRIADRLARLLNRYGANLRRIETDRPPPVLWEDGVQAVTRRPRGPAVAPEPIIERRWRQRRQRLQKRRQRAGRQYARAAKVGLRSATRSCNRPRAR